MTQPANISPYEFYAVTGLHPKLQMACVVSARETARATGVRDSVRNQPVAGGWLEQEDHDRAVQIFAQQIDEAQRVLTNERDLCELSLALHNLLAAQDIISHKLFQTGNAQAHREAQESLRNCIRVYTLVMLNLKKAHPDWDMAEIASRKGMADSPFPGWVNHPLSWTYQYIAPMWRTPNHGWR